MKYLDVPTYRLILGFCRNLYFLGFFFFLPLSPTCGGWLAGCFFLLFSSFTFHLHVNVGGNSLPDIAWSLGRKREKR